MGIELELYVLLALLTLDLSIFAVFEVEIPRWRKLLQWVIISTTTLGLYLRGGAPGYPATDGRRGRRYDRALRVVSKTRHPSKLRDAPSEIL